MRAPPAPLHPVIAVGPFAKWEVNFITCNPASAGHHHYIIVAVNYFTKWAESMPTSNNDGRTAALFILNHVIARFGVPKTLVTDHCSNFQNHMMAELALMLGFKHEHSTPYYPQANGQVETVNKVLNTMLQRKVHQN